MKKTLAFIFLSFLLSLEFCIAQGTRDEVMQDLLKSGGLYYVYDYKAEPAMTPAPDGYKPFYISHFGRHGARFCRGEYKRVRQAFSTASKADALTPLGKELFDSYKKFYKEVSPRKGNLTEIGQEQHREIAARMFRRFPEVFEGPTHVDAISSETNRVIMSMWSFLSSLQSLDGSIDFSADASARHASYLQPMLEGNPYLIRNLPSCNSETEDALKRFFYSTVDWKPIYGRLFKSPDYAREELGIEPESFLRDLQRVDADAQCLDDGANCFDGFFSPEEKYALWKAGSARNFAVLCNYSNSGSLNVDYAAFTLAQIIESADSDIASGNTRLRLRFGHDSGIMPLVAFLNLNGCGRVCGSLEEGVEVFPNYNSPMGTSLQLIFYRNASGNVLVKFLHNEKEAVLPFGAAQGPYYSWEDVKNYYAPLIKASKRKIKDLKILREYKWKWEKTGKTSVETASASLKVFGSTQHVTLARFPMKDHRVSIVESDGPRADITSRLARKNKAVAAINGSYFNVETLYPVTLVKDNGKFAQSPTIGDQRRCNGIFRIRKADGREVDVYRIQDTLACFSEVADWREAIVAGPVLLEDGRSVGYFPEGKASAGGDVAVNAKYYKKFYSKRHPRTALGYTGDGMIYFIVVDGRFPGQAEGMSIREMQVLCESLGLYEAINLDGGGSSTLWTAEGGVLNHPYDNKVFDPAGEREVPNIIMVK